MKEGVCEGYKRECVKGVKREYVKAGCKRECVKVIRGSV